MSTAGGSNGPDVVINASTPVYDRNVAYDAPVSYDSGLTVYPNRTLADLRRDMAVAMGYASQKNNLPTGFQDEIDLWLRMAQAHQYYRYSCLHTPRWWAWQLTPGRRFYDIPVDGTDALNFRRIEQAWLADNGGVAMLQWAATTAYTVGQYLLPTTPNGFIYKVTVAGTTAGTAPAWPTTEGGTVVNGTVTFKAQVPLAATWLPLAQGIDPARFTNAQRTRPDSYETRQFLELWPEPEKAYVVYLFGHMGLRRFSQPTDECTIDADVVLTFAIAMGKKAKRHVDADAYAQMAARLAGDLNAASLGNKRWIPQPDTAGMKNAPDTTVKAPPVATWRT